MVVWTPGRPLSVLSGADDQELDEAIRGRGPGGFDMTTACSACPNETEKIFHPTHENSPFER